MNARSRSIVGVVLLVAAAVVLVVYAYQATTFDSRHSTWEHQRQVAEENFRWPPTEPMKPAPSSYGLAAAGLAIGGVVSLSTVADERRRTRAAAAGTTSDATSAG